MKLGFVITNDREEYLVYVRPDSAVWSSLVSMAKVFSRSAALDFVRRSWFSYPVYELELHETDQNYIVTRNENRPIPSWLKQ